jgi:DNA-binding CsgD family transcriptional regulator
MRVIIVEGMLGEVLAVLEKTRQSNDITRFSPVADAADEHHGNGAGNDEPDKKGCSPLPLLSCRERSIIAHLMEGHSNKVIARDLGLAEPTVKSHVKNILNKIGATNRTQAAMWGRTNLGESRLLPPSSAVLSSRQQPSVAVEQWLKGKVEAGQGLDTNKASHLERRLDAPSFAQGELPASQQQDGKYPLDRSGRRK